MPNIYSIKNALRRVLCMLLCVVMIMGFIPTGSLAAGTYSDTLDGWTVQATWSTLSRDYKWDAETDTTGQPKLAVTYATNKAARDYAPGELKFTIPGIGRAYRSDTVKASSISADKADSDWGYTWDKGTDTYTFTNKFSVSAGQSMSGGFEILWAMPAKDIVNGSELIGTPKFSVSGEEISLEPLSFSFSSTRNTIRMDLASENILTTSIPEPDPNYAWYRVYPLFSINKAVRPIAEYNYSVYITLPGGCDYNMVKVQQNGTMHPLSQDGSGRWYFPAVQGKIDNLESYSIEPMDLYIGFDKATLSGVSAQIRCELSCRYEDEVTFVNDGNKKDGERYSFQVTKSVYGFDYKAEGYNFYLGMGGQNSISSSVLAKGKTLDFNIGASVTPTSSEAAAASADAAVIAEPDASPQPAEDLADDVTPAEAEAPAESVSPEETETPAEAETEALDETIAPAESAAPTEAESPVVSETPVESETPTEAESPVEAEVESDASAPAQNIESSDAEIQPLGEPPVSEQRQEYLVVGMDHMSVMTKDGSYRALRDEEYSYTSLRLFMLTDGHTVSVYTANRQDAAAEDYTLAYENISDCRKTYPLPAGTKAVRIESDNLTQAFNLNPVYTVKFESVDMSDIDPNGLVSAYIYLKYMRLNDAGTYDNVAAAEEDSYREAYGEVLKERDKLVHGSPVHRSYKPVIMNEPAIFLKTTSKMGTIEDIGRNKLRLSLESGATLKGQENNSLKKFSLITVVPSVVRPDLSELKMTGYYTDGTAIGDVTSHMTSRESVVAGKRITVLDFDFSDRPINPLSNISVKAAYSALLSYGDYTNYGGSYTVETCLIAQDETGDAPMDMDIFQRPVQLGSDVSDYDGDGDRDEKMATSTSTETLNAVAIEWREFVDKTVKGPSDSEFTASGSVTEAVPGSEGAFAENAKYSYLLEFGIGAEVAKNIVFYDFIEANQPWQGRLVSVDTTQVRRMGIVPTVYYATDANAPMDIADSAWSVSAPADMAAVKAIAVSFNPAELNDSVFRKGYTPEITLNMEAPALGTAEVGTSTSNSFVVKYRACSSIEDPGEEVTIESSATTVDLKPAQYDTFTVKVVDALTDEPISGWRLNLDGEGYTTNSNGSVVLNDVPLGDHTWSDASGKAGYYTDDGEHTFTVSWKSDSLVLAKLRTPSLAKGVKTEFSNGYESESSVVETVSGAAGQLAKSAEYSYNIELATYSKYAKDAIIYDNLETANGSAWHGVFRGVDTSAAEASGFITTLYYSEAEDAPHDISDPAWTTETPENLAEVKAVAVAFSTSEDSTMFSADKRPSVTILMSAPAMDVAEAGKTAANMAYCVYTSCTESGADVRRIFQYTNTTKLTLDTPKQDELKIKVVNAFTDAPISGWKISVDDGETLTTDSRGLITLTGIEVGEHKWKDISGVSGYYTDDGEHVFDVAGDGSMLVIPKTVVPEAYTEVRTGTSDGYYIRGSVYASADNTTGTMADKAKYSYCLSLETKAKYVKDAVIFNEIERGEGSAWQGTLLGVTASNACADDVDFTVYYSTQESPAKDLNDSAWTTTPPDKLSDVKSIAVAFTATDGGVIPGGSTLAVDVQMLAPRMGTIEYAPAAAMNGCTGEYTACNTATDSGRRVSADSNLAQVRASAPAYDKFNVVILDDTTGEPIPAWVLSVDSTKRTTNDDGTVSFYDITLGEHTWVDVTGAPGYKTEKTPVSFTVVGGENTLVIRKTRILGTVTLEKTSEANGLPIPGVAFDLYSYDEENDERTLVNSYVTDNSGSLRIADLPWGKYILKETSTPDGKYVVPDDEISFEIGPDKLSEMFSITNAEVPTSVVFTKRDAESSAALQGAVYRLDTIPYDALKALVGDSTDYSGIGEEQWNIGDREYKTDVLGRIVFDSLPFGLYRLTETYAPEGYNINPEQIVFLVEGPLSCAINGNGTYANGRLNLEHKDERKLGSVVLQKQSEDGYPLESAVFNLYNADGSCLAEDGTFGKGSASPMAFTTDADGKITVSELKWGDYYFLEVEAPAGYELDETPVKFTIDASNAGTTVSLNVANGHAKGSVVLTKTNKYTDEADKVLLEGAEFSLYKNDGTLVKAGLVTGADGTLRVDGLDWGSYYFEETKAPAGYSISGNKVRFSVNEATCTQVQEVSCVNEQGLGELRITETIDTQYAPFGGATFMYEVSGTDISGKSLTWTASITVPEGSNSGSTVVSGVPFGSYTVTAVKVARYTPSAPESVSVTLGESAMSADAAFAHTLGTWTKFSHNSRSQNTLSAITKPTAFAVEHLGPAVIESETESEYRFTSRDLSATIYYDDGSSAVVPFSNLTIDPEKVTGNNNTTGAGYTVTVSYTELGMLFSDSFSVEVSLQKPKLPFTVTYNANGGHFYAPDDTTLTMEYIWAGDGATMLKAMLEGDKAYIHSGEFIYPVRDKYLFAGWDVTGQTIDGVTPVTLTALWEPLVVVTYYGDGGHFNGDENFTENKMLYRKASDDFTLIDAIQSGNASYIYSGTYYQPEWNDYSFDGWSFYGNTSEEVWTYELHPNWMIPVQVTYDANGGYFDGDENKSQNIVKYYSDGDANNWVYVITTGDTKDVAKGMYSEPQRDGYEFAGWSYDEAEAEKIGDITLTAKWVELFAMFETGSSFNSHMLSLRPSGAFTRASAPPSTSVSYVEVQDSTSSYEIYLWKESGNMYWYCEAERVYLNPDSSSMFASRSELSSLDASGWDASKVTNMKSMFAYCSGFTSLVLKNWDTSHVTDMSEMFRQCHRIISLDVSGWNTSNVENMKDIFAYTNFETVNISNWDFSKCGANTNSGFFFTFGNSNSRLKRVDAYDLTLGNMENFLRGAKNLTELNGEETWDFSKATSLMGMFDGCKSLTGLDASDWKLPYTVWSTGSMFRNCSSLTELDSPGLFISGDMFYGCRNLSSVNLSSRNATNSLSYMFYGCSSLTDVGSFKISSNTVTNISHIFDGCSSLPGFSSDTSKWNTEGITDMSYAFAGCSSLTEFNATPADSRYCWKTTSLKTTAYMFYNCSSLKTVTAVNWDARSLSSMAHMFDGCTSLTAVTVRWGRPSALADASYSFNGCTALAEFDSGTGDGMWQADIRLDVSYMFNGCKSLVTARTAGLFGSNRKFSSTTGMYDGCDLLVQ